MIGLAALAAGSGAASATEPGAESATSFDYAQPPEPGPPLPLTGALVAGPDRSLSLGGVLSISYSIDRSTGQSSEAARESPAMRLRAARVIARISPNASVGFALSGGLDRLIADLRSSRQRAFLVAGDPLDDIGFRRRDQTALALRRDFGLLGLTISAEEARSLTDLREQPGGGGTDGRRAAASASRYGLTVDSAHAGFAIAAGASWLTEQRTILGARMRDGFNPAHADSLFLDGELTWWPRSGWRIGAAWRHGMTRSAASAVAAQPVVLRSDAWAIDATRSSVIGDRDSLSLRVAQPLRVSNGEGLALPVEYSYDARGDARVTTSVPLAPTGREIAAELNWQGPLVGGWATIGAFFRNEPGHLAARSNDHGAAISWAARF